MFTLKFCKNILLKNSFSIKTYCFNNGEKSEIIGFLETPLNENSDFYNTYSYFFSISSDSVDNKKYIPIHLFEMNKAFLSKDTEKSVVNDGKYILMFKGNDDISFARRFISKNDAFYFIIKYDNSINIDSFLDDLYINN